MNPDTPSSTPEKASRPLWQKLLMLVGLVVLLVLINALYEAAASWQGIVTGEPESVLYTASFDDAADDWQQYDGRLSAAVTGEAMRISVGSDASTAYSAASPVFRDFDATLLATAINGPVDNAFGVVFRLSETADQCNMPLLILCELAKVNLFGVPLRLMFRPADSTQTGYYMFLISSDGYHSLWRGGTGSAEKISAWIANDAIEQGLNATNRIRVVGRGDTFQFFINGQSAAVCIPDDPAQESTYFNGECLDGEMQTIWHDDTYPVGRIGVVAQSTQTGGSGVVVDFDSIIVSSPATDTQDTDAQT